jgi:two-component system, chemotaxis family, chemotaxis protein CheY
MKALVVNGSATERAVFSAQLTWLGLESETAATAEEALDLLRRDESFAVLLLSWSLQGSDGLELLRRVRAEARWADLPVVLVTGMDDLARIEQAHDAAASEFLLQPSDAQALLEKLLILGVDPEAPREAPATGESPVPPQPRIAPLPRTPEDPEARRAA